EIAELRCAGFAVSAGDNALRPGIAPVTARLETDRLRIVPGCCPNLLREASLYRYSEDRTDRRSEAPVDEHNHALAALRYLVSAIDARQMARLNGKTEAGEAAGGDKAKARERGGKRRTGGEGGLGGGVFRGRPGRGRLFSPLPALPLPAMNRLV